MKFYLSGTQPQGWPLSAWLVTLALAGALLLTALPETLVRVKQRNPLAAHTPPLPPVASPAANAPKAGGSGGGLAPSLPSWRSSPHVAAANHTYSLERWELDRGIVSYGERARVRRAFSKLLAGQPMTVAFLGASVTCGIGARVRNETGYAAQVLKWLHQTFPTNPGLKLVNGCVQASISSYFALCPEYHAPLAADLVFVELNLNDGRNTPYQRGHERLIRRLLNYPNRPAVVEVVHYVQPWGSTPEAPLYRYRGDDDTLVAGIFYRLPLLSTRSLIWGRAQIPRPAPVENEKLDDPLHGFASLDEVPGGKFTYMFADTWGHPNEAGHKWLSEMVIHWMEGQLDHVARLPLAPEDEMLAQMQLPDPMYLNNWETKVATCQFGESAKALLVSKDDAWEWRHEGPIEKKKFGFISEQPGSVLRLAVNTNVSQLPDAKISLVVAFLRSYEHMGQFEMSCVQGCACSPLKVDGHHPADTCHLQFTVLPGTSSGEHKAKIIGLVISDQPPEELTNSGMGWSFTKGAAVEAAEAG